MITFLSDYASFFSVSVCRRGVGSCVRVCVCFAEFDLGCRGAVVVGHCLGGKSRGGVCAPLSPAEELMRRDRSAIVSVAVARLKQCAKMAAPEVGECQSSNEFTCTRQWNF